MQHTPGPWSSEACHVTANGVYVGYLEDFSKEDEVLAAAAPELLQALEAMLAIQEDILPGDPLAAEALARAAIGKAKGWAQ